MLNRLKTFLPLLLIPLCFFVGLYAGPKATELYAKVFPPKEYTTGDHDALYAKAGHNVVMYTTSTCPFCAKTRALFAAKGVKYIEYQVDKSKTASDEFTAKGGIGVPLLYIGERRIDGYREAAILDALAAVR